MYWGGIMFENIVTRVVVGHRAGKKFPKKVDKKYKPPYRRTGLVASHQVLINDPHKDPEAADRELRLRREFDSIVFGWPWPFDKDGSLRRDVHFVATVIEAPAQLALADSPHGAQ